MASDESLTMVYSSMQDDENDDTDDGSHQNQQGNLSRLSICTSSMYDEEDDDVVNNYPSDMSMFMSRLSLESFDGADADGEVSEGGKEDGGGSSEVISSDSDKEPGFYSLPETPRCRRRKLPAVSCGPVANKTDSEGQDGESDKDGRRCNLRRQRRAIKEKASSWMDKKGKDYHYNLLVNNSMSGESDRDREHGGAGGGVSGGLMVMTRPKGGKRSLCMGYEEVKACRDLGFELEVVPGQVSISAGSTLDTQTSSGGNSPIANWRISGPGDDPREVKARLKVWAQAVALVSASRHVS